MLGRYTLTGTAPGLGTMTLAEKARAIRIGGFTVAGLALLAIPVIIAWPAIVWWKKYGWAVKFGKRRIDTYRRVKREVEASRPPRGTRKARRNPGLRKDYWMEFKEEKPRGFVPTFCKCPGKPTEVYRWSTYKTRRDWIPSVVGTRCTVCGKSIGHVAHGRETSSFPVKKNAAFHVRQGQYVTIPETCPKCSHGRMGILPTKKAGGVQRLICPQCRFVKGGEDYSRPKKKSIKKVRKPRNMFQPVYAWSKGY